MGNAQVYSDYWNKLEVLARDTNELSVAEKNYTVTNTHTYKSYYVSKQIALPQLLYVATDENAEQVFLRVFHLSNYDEVRKHYAYLNKLKEELVDEAFIKVKDCFFTFTSREWVFIVVEEFISGLSLASWLECLTIESKLLHRVCIPVEKAICAFTDVIEKVAAAFEAGFNMHSVSPSNLMIARSSQISEQALLTWESQAYYLKISPFKVDSTGVEPNMMPPEGFNSRESSNVWFCGITVLAALIQTPVKNLPKLGLLSEEERFKYLDEHLPPGIVAILKCCLSDAVSRPTYAEILELRGLRLFNQISRLTLTYADQTQYLDQEVLDESVLPILEFFMTSDDIKKQELALKLLLELMTIWKTEPLNYILKRKLHPEMISILKNMMRTDHSERLISSAVNFGTLALLKKPSLKHLFKKIGYVFVISKAMRILENKQEIYRFVDQFARGNTLTIMEISSKNMLFLIASDNAATDSDAMQFVRDTISYYGSKSFNFIKVVRNFSDQDILNMILQIPIHLKVMNSKEVFIRIKAAIFEQSRRRPLEQKLEIIEAIVNYAIEILFYWPWLKFSHAHGICSTSVKDYGEFINPILFTCKECKMKLCKPCASTHHHSFTSLEYCGYRSGNMRCTADNENIELKSLDFLKRPSDSEHIILCNGEPIINHKSSRAYSKVINTDTNFLVGAVPLITERDKAKTPETTLSYYEVEVRNGGLFDNISVGFTNFEYRGDTGRVRVDGQDVDSGPFFGSYDVVGVGITANHVYLTLNGLLLRPLYDHPRHTDYKLAVTLTGKDTSVNVKLSSATWTFKPPFTCTFESWEFIPERFEEYDESFFRHMKNYVKGCEEATSKPALVERFLSLKNKSDKIMKFLQNCNFKSKPVKPGECGLL